MNCPTNMDKDSMNDLYSDHNNKLISDFIAITTLVGNDFLPHNPTIDVQRQAINLIIDAYHHAVYSTKKNQKPQYIINHLTSKLNLRLWKRFFEFMSRNEAKRAKQQELKYKMQKGPKFISNQDSDNPVKLQKDLHNLYHNIPRSHTNWFGRKDWTKRFYKEYLSIPNMYHDSTMHYDLQRLCKGTLEAIGFVHSYYTRGCIDYRWIYTAPYQPLTKQIFYYLQYYEKVKTNKGVCLKYKSNLYNPKSFTQKKAINKPLTTTKQLIAVCPITSIDSLGLSPKLLIQIRSPKLSIYYPDPTSFITEGLFAKYTWQKHIKNFEPYIPSILYPK